MTRIPAAGSAAPSQLVVTSQLAQSYVLADPAVATGPVALAQNANGDPEVFAVNGAGSVSRIYVDAASDSGWSVQDLAFPTAPAGAGALLLAATQDQSGVVRVLASNALDQIFELVGPGAADSAWSEIVVDDLPVPSDLVSLGYCGDEYVDAGPIAVSRNGYSYFYWNDGWTPSYGPSAGLGPVCYGLRDTPWSPHALGGLYCVNGGALSFCSNQMEVDGDQTNDLLPLLNGCAAIALAALPDADQSLLLLSHGDDGTSTIQRYAGSAELDVVFDGPNPGGAALTALTGAVDASGNPEVFAIDAGGRLYQSKLETSGTGTAWTPLFELGAAYSFRSIQALQLADGNPQLFGVTQSGQLVQCWQDPASTDWVFTPLLVATGASTLQQIVAYQTMLTAYDANGVIAPNAALTLTPDQPTWAFVNGQAVVLHPAAPHAAVANAAGQVALTLPTTALGVASLGVTTPFLAPSQTIDVQPAAGVQAQLLAQTTASLQAATWQDDAGAAHALLVSGTDVSDLLATIQAAMGYDTGPADSASAALHARSQRGIARVRRGAARLSLRSRPASRGRPPPAWSFTAQRGQGVRFQALDAVALQARKLAIAHAEDPALFFGFHVDWGDVVDAVVEGVIDIVECWVEEAEDALTATLQWVVDEVTYAIQTAVSVLEQCFDIVEMAFAQYGVDFDALWRWLGFVFNWADILATRQAMEYGLLQVLGFAQLLIQSTQNSVDAGFVRLKTQFDTYMQQVQSSSIAQTTLGAAASKASGAQSPMVLLATAVDQNPVLSSLFNQSQTNATCSIASLPPAMTQAAAAIVDALTSQAQAFGASPAYRNAVAYFQDLLQGQASADCLLNVAWSGMLALVQTIGDAAIAMAQTVVDALLQAAISFLGSLQSLLQLPLQVPYVSELYEEAAQAPLTVGVLLTLPIALPVTVIYKLAFGQAPFADPAVQGAYTSALSASNLAASCGLSIATSAAPHAQVSDDAQRTIGNIFGVMGAVCTVCLGTVTVAIDWLAAMVPPGTPPNPLETGLSFLEVGAETLAVLSDLPLPFDGLSPTAVADYALAIGAWAIGAGPWLIDTLTTCGVGRVARLSELDGICLSMMAGVVAAAAQPMLLLQSDPPPSDELYCKIMFDHYPEIVSFLVWQPINLELVYVPVAALTIVEALCDGSTIILQIDQMPDGDRLWAYVGMPPAA